MVRKKRRNFDYFEAFEKQTELACKEAKLLIEAIENFEDTKDFSVVMEKAHKLEHSGDMISHDIYTAIARDFVPPIDREDILALAESLDNVLDYIEAVVQRFYMYNVEEMHEGALEFAQTIYKSCKGLRAAMKEFSNFKKSSIKDKVIEVNDLEEEADELFMNLMRRLYGKDALCMEVVVWTQIYSRMESCADACERVADLMNSIVIKNA